MMAGISDRHNTKDKILDNVAKAVKRVSFENKQRSSLSHDDLDLLT